MVHPKEIIIMLKQFMGKFSLKWNVDSLMIQYSLNYTGKRFMI